MTRKHYKLVAEVLLAEKPAGELYKQAWENIVNRLAEAFAADNPNFSKAKFHEACEGFHFSS